MSFPSYQIIMPTRENYFNKAVGNNSSYDVHSGVRSPEWMVKIDDIMKSNVDGFEDHAELFRWVGSSKRKTTSDFGNNLFTSATLYHSLVEIEIANGEFAPALETKMNKGEHLELMTIVRLGNAKDLKVKFQTIAFGNCRIEGFEQAGDRLILQLYVTTKENTVIPIGQDGAPGGNSVSKVDYSKSTAE
ncbi:hypothetical protein [Candidatus Finniella inopinata]|uniref:Type VI secretion system tube protein Hcp n=1 Tax=Candidatus Finniella inopinata TaxID=1696036 RepID=A0A4Q7DEK1_9PROT|nr:hypothetical protein [Candidatus Finniella inopinata]RZI45141.1 hypothetical protein EQU50_08150 [Candidatus Finniella inopinata]